VVLVLEVDRPFISLPDLTFAVFLATWPRLWSLDLSTIELLRFTELEEDELLVSLLLAIGLDTVLP
jgi:hypothetical protein